MNKTASLTNDLWKASSSFGIVYWLDSSPKSVRAHPLIPSSTLLSWVAPSLSSCPESFSSQSSTIGPRRFAPLNSVPCVVGSGLLTRDDPSITHATSALSRIAHARTDVHFFPGVRISHPHYPSGCLSPFLVRLCPRPPNSIEIESKSIDSSKENSGEGLLSSIEVDIGINIDSKNGSLLSDLLTSG